MVNGAAPFWTGKRVLVLGHTGFKGAWLCLWLRELGAEVCGLSLPPTTEPSLFAAAGLERLTESRFGDIRELDNVVGAMEAFRPEIVFHLAAQALVRASYREPVETFATNLMGTVHVLAAIERTPSVRAAVIVTTDKCYENREWLWAYREDEKLGGHDPYSASKACAEIATAAWRSSFARDRKLGIATARAGNVIGGGDWSEDRLLPDCMKALAAGRPIPIRNPSATRPWQHVLDPLAGYLTLAEHLWNHPAGYGEAWNFGPVEEDARPVAWIAERIVRDWGGGARWENAADPNAPHEAMALKVDASKARTRLGWSQRLRLDEGLAWTTDWYRAFHRDEPALDLTLEQIRTYQDFPWETT